MGSLIGALIGAIVATLGFIVMRNPMRLAILAPGARGYYQRMVLDTPSRISLRLLGALVCTFGLSIGTAASGGLLKSHILQSISDGFFALLWLLFISAWVAGLVYAVVLLVRGRGLAGFRFGEQAQCLEKYMSIRL